MRREILKFWRPAEHFALQDIESWEEAVERGRDAMQEMTKEASFTTVKYIKGLSLSPKVVFKGARLEQHLYLNLKRFRGYSKFSPDWQEIDLCSCIDYPTLSIDKTIQAL